MVVAVRALLWARLLGIAHAALSQGRRRRLTWAVAGGVGLAGWGGAVLGLRMLLPAVLPPPGASLERLLAGAGAVLVGFTLVSTVGFVLAAVAFARDLPWLLTQPLSPTALLLERLLAQLGLGAGVGVLLLGPVLVAEAWRTAALGLLPVTATAVLALAAIPMAVATLVTVAAIRLLPAARIRAGAGVVAVVVGFGLAAVDVALRPTAVPATGHDLGLLQLGAGPLGSRWLPTGWAARSLVAAWGGHALPALGWAVGLTGLAALAVAGAVGWGGPLLRAGWAHAQEGPAPRVRRERPAASPRRAWVAIAAKDLRVLRRDLVQLSQLLLPVALFAVYAIAPQAGASGLDRVAELPRWYGPALTAGFAALFAASGLGLRGIGSEGLQLWVLRASPTPAPQLLRAKLAVTVAVAITVAWVLLWIGDWRQGVGPGGVLISTLVVGVTVSGLAAAATGLGAAWPRLAWTDPRRAVSLWLSLGFLIVGGGYLGLILGLVAVPYAGLALGAIPAAGMALVLVTVPALGVGWLALRQGGRRLQARDG